MCQGYYGNKNDPKLFDPKHVFNENEEWSDDKVNSSKTGSSLWDLLKYWSKKHRDGYEDGDDMKVCMLVDFVKSTNPWQILCTNHRLAGDKDGFSLYRSENGLPSRQQMISDKALHKDSIASTGDE